MKKIFCLIAVFIMLFALIACENVAPDNMPDTHEPVVENNTTEPTEIPTPEPTAEPTPEPLPTETKERGFGAPLYFFWENRGGHALGYTAQQMRDLGLTVEGTDEQYGDGVYVYILDRDHPEQEPRYSFDSDADGIDDYMQDYDDDGVPNYLEQGFYWYADHDEDGVMNVFDRDWEGFAYLPFGEDVLPTDQASVEHLKRDTTYDAVFDQLVDEINEKRKDNNVTKYDRGWNFRHSQILVEWAKRYLAGTLEQDPYMATAQSDRSYCADGDYRTIDPVIFKLDLSGSVTLLEQLLNHSESIALVKNIATNPYLLDQYDLKNITDHGDRSWETGGYFVGVRDRFYGIGEVFEHEGEQYCVFGVIREYVLSNSYQPYGITCSACGKTHKDHTNPFELEPNTDLSTYIRYCDTCGIPFCKECLYSEANPCIENGSFDLDLPATWDIEYWMPIKEQYEAAVQK